VSRKGATPFYDLFAAFDEADLIVGYNQLDFDFPLLRKYYGKQGHDRYTSHRIKCLDIFQRVRGVLGIWPKLEHLLQVNGLPGKSGSGANAVTLWNEGKRKELKEYCAIDVLRTIQLALLPHMNAGPVGSRMIIPGFVYGVVPALSSVVAAKTQSEAPDMMDPNDDTDEWIRGSTPQLPMVEDGPMVGFGTRAITEVDAEFVLVQ